MSHHKTSGSGNRWRVCSTFQHTRPLFPAKIVIQAGDLETWSIDIVDMKSLKEFFQISRGLFNTCAPFSAKLVSPSASDAVLSTTDAYRNVHVTSSRSSHVIWVKEQTQRSPLQRPCESIHSAKQRLSHDTIVTFHRFIATQVATSPLEEFVELKKRKLSSPNIANGKSSNVAGARSASVLDVYNFCPT